LKPNQRSRQSERRLARRHERTACIYTLEAYNSSRSVAGQPQAIDYSQRNPGSQSAQYRDDSMKYYQIVDFITDVHKAVKDTLTPAEYKWFVANLQDQDEIDLTHQPDPFLDLQEKLGKVFLERGLYPLGGYFTVIKK
jgi:hypothetical protein